jgi:hypothetical protein
MDARRCVALIQIPACCFGICPRQISTSWKVEPYVTCRITSKGKEIIMNDYGAAPERPYQCFMGRWEGLCKTFDPEGHFLESSAVHMNVYWTGPNTWHLYEHFENLYGVGETIYETEVGDSGRTDLPC